MKQKQELRKGTSLPDRIQVSFQRYRGQCGDLSVVLQALILGWTLFLLVAWSNAVANQAEEPAATIGLLSLYITVAVPLTIAAIMTRKQSKNCQAGSTIDTPPSKSFVVGHASIDGIEMCVFSDEIGRKWCNYPRRFRLWEEANDWLLERGAYMFDNSHFVIDDPNSSECIYVQLRPTQDGRYVLSFLTHRDHWPRNVPIFAKRLLSASQQATVAAQQATARNQQNAQLATVLGLAALAAALARR